MAVRLNRDEQVVLETLAARVDLSRVLLHRGERPDAIRRAVLWASRGRAVTLGNHVFLPDSCAGDVPVLAHELTHCGQYQAWGAWTYFRRGLITQCRDLLHRTNQHVHDMDAQGDGAHRIAHRDPGRTCP